MRRLSIIFLLVLSLSACGPKGEGNPAPRQATGVGSVTDLSGQDRPDFPAVEYALETDPASVIPVESLEVLGGLEAYEKSVPEGAEFVTLPKTWRRDGVGGGVVRMNLLLNGEVERKAVVIMLEDQNRHWFVVQTMTPAEYRALTSG